MPNFKLGNERDIQEEDSKDNNKNSKKKLRDKYEQNNQCIFEKDNKDKQKYSNNEIPVTQKSDSEVKCIHCIFDKELDRRHYYFGNLLIGELQYLPPCMRSKAYINILNYVNKLKDKYKEEPLD
ncbi:unnamed protein product [Euphydryas editha]|uniref:Uncharacterized protein n=1 Tax=Euphydryas editha TaxID=104508 RepID=A0AAU9TL55_EUPED|nr:unnamed protein product [Euphydryas editha]